MRSPALVALDRWSGCNIGLPGPCTDGAEHIVPGVNCFRVNAKRHFSMVRHGYVIHCSLGYIHLVSMEFVSVIVTCNVVIMEIAQVGVEFGSLLLGKGFV